MNVRHLAPRAGALACLATALAGAAPFLLIDGHAELLGDYYGAGPIGLTMIVIFAAVGVVAFASAERGNVDPVTMAGGLVVLGVVLTAVAGYALIETLGGGLGAIPPELAMTAVFGAFLLVTAAATRRHVPHR